MIEISIVKYGSLHCRGCEKSSVCFCWHHFQERHVQTFSTSRGCMLSLTYHKGFTTSGAHHGIAIERNHTIPMVDLSYCSYLWLSLLRSSGVCGWQNMLQLQARHPLCEPVLAQALAAAMRRLSEHVPGCAQKPSAF